MSERQDLLQGVREWLKAASGTDPSNAGTHLSDVQVRKWPVTGPRPTVDYLAVRVLTSGQERGRPERLIGEDGASSTTKIRQMRTGTVSVQAFGADAVTWLERAVLHTPLDAVQDVLTAQGLEVIPLGAARDLTELVDTVWEERVEQSFQVEYQVTSAADTVAALGTVQADLNLYKSTPTDADRITETVTPLSP